MAWIFVKAKRVGGLVSNCHPSLLIHPFADSAFRIPPPRIKQMINTYPFLTVYGISLCFLQLPYAGLNLWNHITPNQLQLSVPFLQPIEYHPFDRML